MKAQLSYTTLKKNISSVTIPGSKSESNRLLILQALYPTFSIVNCSNSDDTLHLIKGLGKTNGTVNIAHAGTAMRFLTAYYAAQTGVNIILTGSNRMKERPIEALVDALKSLGAEIHYLERTGFPPLHIFGKKLNVSAVSIKADISSQFISALLLIAPSLSNGLKLELEGEITSRPYIEMTLKLLRNIGVSINIFKNKIEIFPLLKSVDKTITIESDWSSASYFYSLVALSKNIEITLKSFSKNSLQGDSILPALFKPLGVKTSFNTSENTITLECSGQLVEKIDLDLNNTPDIAQTIAVTCFGLGMPCKLRGLKTLKIKETDRLFALKTELEKLGANVDILEDTIEVFSSGKINKNRLIETYQDHRMAMAFAPLAIMTPIEIEDPNVVSKSYSTFWQDLKKIGVNANFK